MKKFPQVFFAFFILQTGFSQEIAPALERPLLWLVNDSSSTTPVTKKANSAYHFNFNPVYSGTGSDLVHTNILTNKYSLFAVFRSDLEDEIPLVHLKLNGATTTISNKQLVNSKENQYKQVDTRQGIVLTYLVSHEKKAKNKSRLLLENLSRPQTEEGYRNDVMELLYYPRVVNDVEKQKIESYLSLKYGISLLGEADYLNSAAEKIWDFKENKSYNHRVTGIGKDQALHLDQKQSGNAQKDGLFIGLERLQKTNKENTVQFPDKSFLLWGDNDGSLKMEAYRKSSNPVRKMKRIWKMQRTDESQPSAPATQVMLDKAMFFIDGTKQKENPGKEEDLVWLVIDRNSSPVFDYHNAEYHKQSRDEKEKLFFDNVLWDTDNSGSDTYTFIKGPDFFVDYEVTELDCHPGSPATANLKIIGGKAPFQLDLISDSGTESHSIEGRSFAWPDLDAGSYLVHATDKMQRKQSDTLTLNGLKNVSIALASQWSLNASKEAILVPQIENPENQKLSLAWKRGEILLSTERQFTATEEGDYTLTVSNEAGCQNEMAFKVASSNSSHQGWVLYPNPAKMDEPFHIKFQLEKESDVSVALFDFSNKLLKRKELGKIKASEYTETLSTIGTFLIVVVIDGKAASAKIIIR